MKVIRENPELVKTVLQDRGSGMTIKQLCQKYKRVLSKYKITVICRVYAPPK